jgi:hypothetical protein
MAEGYPTGAGQPQRRVNVDEWLEKTKFIAPPGGEYIVQSAETFMSSGRKRTPEEVDELIELAQAVLERYKNETPEHRAKRERFEAIIEEKIASVSPDNPDVLVDFLLDILDGKYSNDIQ